MLITSTSNSLVKELRKLRDCKEFLFLDNPKLVEEAKQSGRTLEYVVFEDGKQEKFKNIVGKTNLIVSENVFKALSNSSTSQGLLAIVKSETKKFKPPCGNFLVLDEVQDPGNVGTLLRSALAFGFNDVYLINCASLTNEKVVRSTMGALFKLNACEISRQQFVEKFKNSNLICGQMDGVDVRKQSFEFPVGIIVGNEGNGVSTQLKEISKSVAIKMERNIESLNVAVAGSILMFEIKNKGEII